MIVVGIDEAGRGPLAGNVIAAAVILPPNFNAPELTDSKKLSAAKRDTLYSLITQECIWAVAQSSPMEIDKINILQATMLAMQRAIINLKAKHDKVLVDGNRRPKIKNCYAIVKGDLLVPVISAASIIAKVTRDTQMLALDEIYPQYNFAQHKGYPTKQHIAALKKYGATAEHRKSFAPVKKTLNNLWRPLHKTTLKPQK